MATILCIFCMVYFLVCLVGVFCLFYPFCICVADFFLHLLLLNFIQSFFSDLFFNLLRTFWFLFLPFWLPLNCKFNRHVLSSLLKVSQSWKYWAHLDPGWHMTGYVLSLNVDCSSYLELLSSWFCMQSVANRKFPWYSHKTVKNFIKRKIYNLFGVFFALLLC